MNKCSKEISDFEINANELMFKASVDVMPEDVSLEVIELIDEARDIIKALLIENRILSEESIIKRSYGNLDNLK